MKACILLALLGSASGQAAADKDDTSQPNYTTMTPKYTEEEMKAKVCTTDLDCVLLGTGDGSDPAVPYRRGACLQHMWKYGAQHESAKGCWDLSLCWNANGHQSYLMFDKRKIRWFCSDSQIGDAKIEKDKLTSLVWAGAPAGSKPQYSALTAAEGSSNFSGWETYKESCAANADCEGENQKCTKLLWEAKAD